MSAATAPHVGASTWVIDLVHSSVEFSVKHMMVATATGRFTRLAGTIQLDPANPAAASVVAMVDTASVDTGQAQRDGHLRAEDFFNATQYSTATFRSTRVEVLDDEHAKVSGDLTIRDVTRGVAFDVEFEGQGKDAYGKQRAGFTATTSIDRRDFGIKWNTALETGGIAVGNRVTLTLHIAAVRQDKEFPHVRAVHCPGSPFRPVFAAATATRPANTATHRFISAWCAMTWRGRSRR
jgi:polyisoprenoid-binding protein YceI